MFDLFSYLDKALISMEKRNDYVSKSARCWPSEASAVMLEQDVAPVVGGCHRKTYYRLTGEKTTSQMDAVGARRVRTGKAVEKDVAFQAMEAGLHIASGVRHYVPNIDLAFELDLVILDPSTGGPVIVENKSIYGYMASSQILGNKGHKGRPKLEHVLQTLIYINEIRTGAVLKQAIASALAERAATQRGRVEVTQVNLDMIKDDAKVYGKICYETRDSCETVEFDVEISEPDYLGDQYPIIDGEIQKTFTLKSIYDRYEKLQNYFNKAQAEVVKALQEQGVIHPTFLIPVSEYTTEQKKCVKDYEKRAEKERKKFLRPCKKLGYLSLMIIESDGVSQLPIEEAVTRYLAKQGIVKPKFEIPREKLTAEQKQQVQVYWDRVGEEMRRLPTSFLPPAEYQYKYPDVKIEDLYSKGFIGKTKYAEWKAWKNGKSRKWKGSNTGPIIGDWNCRYCPYKFACIPLQNPELASIVADLVKEDPEEETKGEEEIGKKE